MPHPLLPPVLQGAGYEIEERANSFLLTRKSTIGLPVAVDKEKMEKFRTVPLLRHRLRELEAIHK